MVFRIFLIVLAAICAPTYGAASDSAESADMRQLRIKIQQTDSMLQHIRRQALVNNPNLKARQDEILEVVTAQMKAQGYDADAALAEIGETQNRLRSEELDEQGRDALMQQLEAEGEAFRAARAEALESKPVLDFEAALEAELVAAMVEIEPKTESMIADLDALREQLAAIEGDAEG